MGYDERVTEDEAIKAKLITDRMLAYYDSKVVGQRNLGEAILVAMISNGHILLESVPGLAKTTAAKVITESVGGMFSRIQCTPDLIPSDIIGSQIYNMQTNTFENKIGPVYANFVLLDEVNRSSAKTQSAMLEAMQEHEVTIGGQEYKMPDVFVVIATQNPVEQEGTYMLSEAQLDRFLLKVELDYPNMQDELTILDRIEQDVFSDSQQIVTMEEITYLQNLCKRVYIDPAVKEYIVNIVQATRNAEKVIGKELADYIIMGASTRASISFMQASKAVALMNGRRFVVPDDVKAMAQNVLRHRIMLSFAAMADGVQEETIIEAILGAIVTP